MRYKEKIIMNGQLKIGLGLTKILIKVPYLKLVVTNGKVIIKNYKI